MPVKEFFAKHWIPIVISVVLLIALVVVYFEVFAAGSKSGTNNVLASIPNPTNDAPWTQAELISIRSMTTALENMMSGLGWTIFWSDYTPITNLSQAGSRIQLGVYQQYLSDRPSTTLITDINSLVSANPDFNQVRTTLIAQLNSELTGQN